MDDPEQVAAYLYAGRLGGIMSAGYLYHSAQICQVIQGCSKILDLGCGPATQLAQIAQLNPGAEFLGVDLSERMIESARQYVDDLGVRNVGFRIDDITRLTLIPDASVDAVISTLAFHHLPSREHLDASFAQIARVLKPGGAIYLSDFGRLKSHKSVRFFVDMTAAHQSAIFSLDYERSLCAAFLLDELQDASGMLLPFGARVFSTFKVPYLVVVKTRSKPLPTEIADKIAALRRELPPRHRKDLDELRFFFRLGRIDTDPFRHPQFE
ncbi:MAG: class I SAM-dependent methyltransferase [Gammaproteobacteria bacterium]